jgi:phenylacetate-CoA ligase
VTVRAEDDAAYLAQLRFLFDRSPFYRKKLTDAGVSDALAAGGLAHIAALPFTEKDELRQSRTPDNAIGAHLAVPMSEVVRIYSTSGTTGAPSFIPLTATDLANWIKISSRSYGASGMKSGEMLVSTKSTQFAAGSVRAH